MDAWEAASARNGGAGSSSSSTGGAPTAEIFEEQAAGEEDEEGEGEEKVFVAVPEQHKSGRSLLAWALRHVAAVAGAAVVVAHIHTPAQMIPMSTCSRSASSLLAGHRTLAFGPGSRAEERVGSKFHASKLRPEQVGAYRQYEREKVEKHLDEYIHQCSKMKVKCEKLVIENNDVAKGIMELVSLHGVSKLIMGAAADKHYSRKMKMPKSKTALAVLQKADTSCKIWFVCKEHLICTRSAGEWPFVQAQQLARIGIRCAVEKRRRRADLATDVWPVVEPMMKSSTLSSCPSTSSSVQDESSVPHYFLCPILQKIMKNPHIAADGFTYEAEVIKDWLEAHDTSPMTIVTKFLGRPGRGTGSRFVIL